MEEKGQWIKKVEDTRERILMAINEYFKEYGLIPSLRQIGDIMGIKSTLTVHSHLERLRKKGKITWNPEMQRTIRIIDKA